MFSKIILVNTLFWGYVIANNALEHFSIESRKNLRSCSGNTISCPASDICIQFESICDGINDCPGDWDELKCESGRDCRAKSCSYKCELVNGNVTCLCPTGYQLEDDRVCFDVNECIEVKKPCDHNCHNTDGSFHCSCRDGYALEDDGYNCTDIDECITSEICGQGCQNSAGSYKCYCHEGYRLIGDEKCRSTRESEAKLVYTTKQKLYGIHLQNNKEYLLRLSDPFTSSPWFDQKHSLLYWIENHFDGGTVVKSGVKFNKGRNVVVQKFECPHDMAVESLNNKLYIVDQCIPAVIVCEMEGTVCVRIVTKEIDRPACITVDSSRGWIYWIDWNSNYGLQQAGMDGSKREILLNTNQIQANDIIIDSTTETLYWAIVNEIESFNLNSKERVVFKSSFNSPVNSLAVFEEYLYFTYDTFIMRREKVLKKSDDNPYIILNASRTITGLHFHHPLLIPKDKNPCLNATCRYMCLIAPENQFTCACADEYFTEITNDISCNSSALTEAAKLKCNSTEFRCQSGKCIPGSSLCNSIYDCEDREDEQVLNCKDFTTPEPNENSNNEEAQITHKSRKSTSKQIKKLTEALENIENQQKNILKALAKAGIEIEIDSK